MSSTPPRSGSSCSLSDEEEGSAPRPERASSNTQSTQLQEPREVDWDYIDPFETDEFKWELDRTKDPNNIAGHSLTVSFKAWFNARFKRQAFETWVFYVKISKGPGNPVIDRVKCRYVARSAGIAPMSPARGLLMAMLLSEAEKNENLKWVVFVYSILEVTVQYRGQARTTPFRFEWIPILLRGVLPGIVGLVGTAYAAAVFLFIVSALPHFRGRIKTYWILEPGQLAAEASLQFLLSIMAAFFIILLEARVASSPATANPFSMLVRGQYPEREYTLSTAEGWRTIGLGLMIFGAFPWVMRVISWFNSDYIQMIKGKFAHEHSRAFYSWRIRHTLQIQRATLEPVLGQIDFKVNAIAALAVFVLLFFLGTIPAVFFITLLAYELDMGYSLETDSMLMAALNVQLSNGQATIRDCLVDLDAIEYPSAPEKKTLVAISLQPKNWLLCESTTVLEEFE